MKISVAGSRWSKRWRTMEISWETFLSKLEHPLRTGESFAEYQRLPKAEKAKKKEAAGGFVGGAVNGGRRVAGAVEQRWLVTLDADDATAEDWDNAVAINEFAFAAYSTHSHCPAKPRLRWVVPLRRAVSRDEYAAVARQVAFDLGVLETLDPSTYQPERLMYWPTASADGEYLFRQCEGEILDPDEVLARYGPGDAWKETWRWPIGSKEKEIVRRELKKQADPESKRGIVGVFCRTWDVPAAIDEFLADQYEPAGENRYTYTGGSTAAGAVVYEDGAFLFSNHATDPAGGQLCNAFDLVRVHKFGEMDTDKLEDGETDTTKLPSYAAMTAWAAALPEVKRTLVAERLEQARADFEDMTSKDTGVDEQGAEGNQEDGTATDSGEDTSWIDSLSVNHKSGEADPTIENARLILRHDPALQGAIAFNQFSGRPVLLHDVPWRRSGYVVDHLNGVTWTDADDAGLRWWVEKQWSLRARSPIQDAWSLACEEHAFHPVRDYLDSLEWDGVERLDTMLVRWMKAADNKYVRAVTRKWMTGAVARIYEPGIKFDTMLVLVSKQGVGKSTMARLLAKESSWFSPSLGSIEGKEGHESVMGKWIIEVAELSAFNRKESEAVKDFVARQVEFFRPAYARHAINYARQCVFFGSTNDPEFLKDITGDRRFWPVDVYGEMGSVLSGFADEVDQLWAEAVVRYRQHEPIFMETAELNKLAKAAQDEHTVQNELQGMIEEYLSIPLPDNWDDLSIEDRRDYIAGNSLIDRSTCTRVRDKISVTEVRMECLGDRRGDIGKGNDLNTRKVASILNFLPGWTRTGKLERRGPYGPQRVYVRNNDEA